MPQKRFTPEEIIGKLRHVEVLLGQGKKVTEVVKALGVTAVTYYRWRQEYGGMSTVQAKRLKALEPENGQLWKIVADLTSHLPSRSPTISQARAQRLVVRGGLIPVRKVFFPR